MARYRPPLIQGQMYYLADTAVEFAENKGRLEHEARRCCVIVEGNPSLQRNDSDKVIVAPTSSQVDIFGPYDVFIDHPPSPNKPVYLRVEHMQPVLRSELEDYVQRLKPELIDEIMASVARFLGLV